MMKIEHLNATFQPAKIGHPHGLQVTHLKDNSTRNIFIYHEDGKVGLQPGGHGAWEELGLPRWPPGPVQSATLAWNGALACVSPSAPQGAAGLVLLGCLSILPLGTSPGCGRSPEPPSAGPEPGMPGRQALAQCSEGWGWQNSVRRDLRAGGGRGALVLCG